MFVLLTGSFVRGQDLGIEYGPSEHEWIFPRKVPGLIDPFGKEEGLHINGVSMFLKGAPKKVSLQWRPPVIKSVDDEQIVMRGDRLTIVLRTTAQLFEDESDPYAEALDGIAIVFESGKGRVTVRHQQIVMENGKLTNRSKRLAGVSLPREKTKAALPKRWHQIDIEDTGIRLVISVHGKKVLEVPVEDVVPGLYHWGIINSSRYTSSIRNLVIEE